MKKILIILSIFLLVACTKQETKTETKIEETDNVAIGINYPLTHIKKIDANIQDYIDNTYNQFKKEYDTERTNKAELNIDYTYHIIEDRYINISLDTFIDNNLLAHPFHELFTIVYDKSQKKIISLKDLMSIEELKKLLPTIKQELIKKYKDCILLEQIDNTINENLINHPLFLLEEENLIIYFNRYEITAGYCGIIDIKIPLDKINIHFEKKNQESSTVLKQETHIVDTKKPLIALTFDDGPSEYTKKIIDLLKKHEIVATFFVIGNKLEIYKNTIAEMYQNGNEIGNHSYSHKWLTRLKENELKLQIEDTQNLVKKLTGTYPKLLRPTYGSINNYLRKNTTLDIVMWTVDTRDWKLKSGKTIAEKALKTIKNQDIILMHDNHKQTYEALKIMIPILKEKGFEFVTVSELKQIQKLQKEK